MCPTPGCGQSAKLSDKSLQRFQAIFETMFREYKPADANDHGAASAAGSCTITVNLMTGEGIQIPFHPTMTVQELKLTIQVRMNHDVKKQKLLFKELTVTTLLVIVIRSSKKT